MTQSRRGGSQSAPLRPRLRAAFKAAAATLALAAAATVPGCAGCKGKAPLNYVPQDAVAVLVIPSLGQAIRDSKLLLDKFRDGAGAVKLGIDQAKAQMVKELGFDPENPESLKTKGINPEGGLVASMGGDGKSVGIAFGVEDPKTLEKFLRELAGKVTGGTATFQEKDFAGTKVTLLMFQGATEPRAAWGYVGKYVIICPSAKDGKLGEYVAQLAKLETSIKANKTFNTLQSKIGKHHVMVYVDGPAAKKHQAARAEERLKGASEWMKKFVKEQQEAADGFLGYFQGGALALRVSAEGATARGYMAVPAEKGKAIREIFKGTGDAVEFGKYVGPDALVVGRFSLDAKKLMDRLLEVVPPFAKRRVYSGIERMEREIKISLEKDVFALLSGRFAGAMFAPSVDAIKAGPPRDPSDMLRFVPLVGMAQVTDPAKAAELLAKLERVLVMGQIDVKTKTEGDRKVYSIENDGKITAAWTVVKNVLVIGTGDRLGKTVALISKGGDNVLSTVDSSRAKGLLKSDDGIVFYYNISKTADALRAMELPAEIKAILAGALTTISKLADVTVASEVEEEGILGEITLRLK